MAAWASRLPGKVGDDAYVADDGYARHGVDESHDILGWAILLINTLNNPWDEM